MNAPFPPQIVPQFRGVALAIASLLLVNVTSFAQDLPRPADPTTPPPGTSGAESLDAGKVAEEGDHDLEQAAREYQSVLASYEALRPRAAEALFRLAELAAKLQQTNEARSLYTRVVQKFPNVGDFARQSQ
ncbi:MAG: tetratricopeptide repeat protein, partial [Verrucomicrobiae bacterium]|nr:tetratricopeptide repeat protein [Verrucomicrobiae bacterium]